MPRSRRRGSTALAQRGRACGKHPPPIPRRRRRITGRARATARTRARSTPCARPRSRHVWFRSPDRSAILPPGSSPTTLSICSSGFPLRAPDDGGLPGLRLLAPRPDRDRRSRAQRDDDRRAGGRRCFVGKRLSRRRARRRSPGPASWRKSARTTSASIGDRTAPPPASSSTTSTTTASPSSSVDCSGTSSTATCFRSSRRGPSRPTARIR